MTTEKIGNTVVWQVDFFLGEKKVPLESENTLQHKTAKKHSGRIVFFSITVKSDGVR